MILNAAELAAIKERIADKYHYDEYCYPSNTLRDVHYEEYGQALVDIRTLLAEVERYRAMERAWTPKIGDNVRLANSPKMLISKVTAVGPERVCVKWEDEDKWDSDIAEHAYDLEQLISADESMYLGIKVRHRKDVFNRIGTIVKMGNQTAHVAYDYADMTFVYQLSELTTVEAKDA